MKKLLLSLVGILCSVATFAATLTETPAISENHTFIAANVMNAASTTDGTVYDTYFNAYGGSGYSSSKSSSTIDGTSYLNCMQIKSNRQLTFKVASACTMYLYGQNNSSRSWYLGTSSAGTEIGTYTSSSDAIAISISEDYANTTLYLSASGDLYLAGLVFDFSVATTTPLSTPTISIADDGTVTITSDENASSTVYTTDGSTPSASNGTEYTEAFTVTDGTTVQVISIGDGETYSNSDVVSEQFLQTGITVATPTYNVLNGTVELATETTDATIYYSTDGSTYETYSDPITLTADGTVTFYASRDNCTDSEQSSVDVEAITAPSGCSQKILNGDTSNTTALENSNGYSYSDGWAIEHAANSSGTYDKNLSQQGSITIGETSYSAWKASKGRQIIITIPEGCYAQRLTLYSYCNGTSTGSYWSEVNGTSYSGIAYTTQSGTAPAVRVYALDNLTNTTITFTDNGAAQQFVIPVIDYTEEGANETETESVTVTDAGYATYVTTNAVEPAAGVTFYAVTNGDDYVTLTEVTAAPANTPLLIAAEAGTYDLTIVDKADAVTTDLIAAETDIECTGSQYVLASVSDVVGFYKATSGTTLAAGKCYLVDETSTANSKAIRIADEATGVAEVVAETAVTDGAAYNLAGQKVSANTKGIVIINGKKYINK